LFDILKKLVADALEKKDVSAEYFAQRLSAAGDLDFADAEYRSASSAGRTLMRKAIEAAIGLSQPTKPTITK